MKYIFNSFTEAQAFLLVPGFSFHSDIQTITAPHSFSSKTQTGGQHNQDGLIL